MPITVAFIGAGSVGFTRKLLRAGAHPTGAPLRVSPRVGV